MFTTLAQQLLLDASQPAGWTLVGLIAYAIFGMINRILDSSTFRRQTNDALVALKAKDEAQQLTIDALTAQNEAQAEKITELKTQLEERSKQVVTHQLTVQTERRLKMDCREKMTLIGRVVEVYRATHGRHDDDKLDLRSLYAFRDDPEVRQP